MWEKKPIILPPDDNNLNCARHKDIHTQVGMGLDGKGTETLLK